MLSCSWTLVSAVCSALALLAAVNACCLPNKFAMNFMGEIEEDSGLGAKKNYTITGSIGAEFDIQKFTLQYYVRNTPVKKIWVLEPLKGEFLYTRQINQEPAVCHVVHRIDGLVGKDYRCFLGNKKLVETTGKTYKLRLGRYAKMTGFFKRSSENSDICEPQGLQTFSISTGPGKALRVRLFVTSIVTGSLIDFTPKCTEQRPLRYKGLAIPTMAQLSKMSGKGMAAMFSKLWPADDESDFQPAEQTTENPTTVRPTTTEPTTIEPTTEKQTTSTQARGRYVWNGHNWEWMVDGDVEGSGDGSDGDDEDENTDGTDTDGSGYGNTSDEDGDDDKSESGEKYTPTTTVKPGATKTTTGTERTTTSPTQGRYVWNGHNWEWMADGDVEGSGNGSGNGSDDDDDDDDDSTDGSVVDERGSGSGNGNTDDEDGDTSESEEKYVNNTGEGDVDGDGDYDDYDREYWEYYWKDEDQSIADWEAQYDNH